MVKVPKPPSSPNPEPTPPAVDAANVAKDKKRWGPDDPNMVIRGQPATAVWVNGYDQVVICQEAHGFEDDDPFIFVDRHNLPALIAKLKEYV